MPIVLNGQNENTMSWFQHFFMLTVSSLWQRMRVMLSLTINQDMEVVEMMIDWFKMQYMVEMLIEPFLEVIW